MNCYDSMAQRASSVGGNRLVAARGSTRGGGRWSTPGCCRGQESSWWSSRTREAQTGYIQFSQPLIVSPVMDRQGKRIYVVGEQSSLYTLDANDLSCLGVYYLGHAQGSIQVAPVTLLDKVAVAVNTGAMTSQLRLLGTDESGDGENGSGPHTVAGLVSTRLLTVGRRLVALTSQGLVIVYEIGSGKDSDGTGPPGQTGSRKGRPRGPLRTHATRSLQQPVACLGGGTKLNQMAILPTGGRLPVRDIDQIYSADLFDHPLQMAGNLLIHVRRPAGQAGAIVAAMDSTTGAALWETEVAVPLAGQPVVDMNGPRITAATATGAVYELDRTAMGKRVGDRTRRLPPLQPEKGLEDEGLPLTESVALMGGKIIFAARQGARQLLLYQARREVAATTKHSSGQPKPCPPVAWGEGVVVPTRMGQVYYFDASTLNDISALDETRWPLDLRTFSTATPGGGRVRVAVSGDCGRGTGPQ